MMRSKRFSRNSAKLVLCNCFLLALAVSGCSSSPTPTFTKATVEEAVPRLLKNEYKQDATAKLVGATLWVYVPVEDMFERPKAPEKYSTKFLIEKNASVVEAHTLQSQFQIKAIPEKEKEQEWVIRRQVSEQIGNAWKVIRRVIFSMHPAERDAIKFLMLVIADIKNGIEIKEMFYYLDLKKVSYSMISIQEYQHRIVQDSGVVLGALKDRKGKHLRYREILMPEFISRQIEYRINLKFQKPEVEQNADIDKEVRKIVVETLRIYGIRDITDVQIENLISNERMVLTAQDIWGSMR
ncbi:MAG TPA: hypothetical protein P5110_04180 [Candidatus Omnitrophota bacterium]|nr:hypothetical protein [Candidatus Omnitrophota bacterium]